MNLRDKIKQLREKATSKDWEESFVASAVLSYRLFNNTDNILRLVEAAKAFHDQVSDLQLNNYQEDFRMWLRQALEPFLKPIGSQDNSISLTENSERISEIKARLESHYIKKNVGHAEVVDDIRYLLSRIETLTRSCEYYRDSREKVRIELVQANYRLQKLESANAIAVSALQCYCDKSGWDSGQYENPSKPEFDGWDFDNLAARAIDLMHDISSPPPVSKPTETEEK